MGRLDARMGGGRIGEGGGPPVWSSGLEVEVVGPGLVEFELRHRLGLGGVEVEQDGGDDGGSKQGIGEA